MKGVKHYTASGAVHTGAKHKMKNKCGCKKR